MRSSAIPRSPASSSSSSSSSPSSSLAFIAPLPRAAAAQHTWFGRQFSSPRLLIAYGVLIFLIFFVRMRVRHAQHAATAMPTAAPQRAVASLSSLSLSLSSSSLTMDIDEDTFQRWKADAIAGRVRERTAHDAAYDAKAAAAAATAAHTGGGGGGGGGGASFVAAATAAPGARRARDNALARAASTDVASDGDGARVERKRDAVDDSLLLSSVRSRLHNVFKEVTEAKRGVDHTGGVGTRIPASYARKKTKTYSDAELSAMLADFHRDPPKAYDARCDAQQYDIDALPSASIIICFRAESDVNMARSVQGILDRTDERLVRDIVLVDDDNQFALHPSVYELSPKIKLVHNERAVGLMRARMQGAAAATGDVLVFLDSHIEVNHRWLEPLLARLHEQPHSAVVPVIDVISDDGKRTYQPITGTPQSGGISRQLTFVWVNSASVAKRDPVHPFGTPVMAGGLFAMRRDYFDALGRYDNGMETWGYENTELSLRLWLCGGRLDTVPCSHIGHIFRKHGMPKAYFSGSHSFSSKNKARVQAVWVDDDDKYASKVQGFEDAGVLRQVAGDVSERIELKRRLQCKPFSWFIDNVFREWLDPSLKFN